MSKMLVTVPDQLERRFKATIPRRQRSLFLVNLLEKAIEKQERHLFECAKLVEADESLMQDLQAWDITVDDGLDDTEVSAKNI